MRNSLLALCLFTVLQIQAQKFNSLAQTAPIGWNSWNKTACEGQNEQVIRDVADVMQPGK